MTVQFSSPLSSDQLPPGGLSFPIQPEGTQRDITLPPRKEAGQRIALSFPRGLLGYPEDHDFWLTPMAESQLPGAFLLRSQASQGPRFLVVPPSSVGGELPADEVDWAERRLGIARGDLRALLIVTPARSDKGTRFFANRRAPLLLDWGRRCGWQRILMDEVLPVRQSSLQQAS
ncbi:flagellar assembly protein FliW [Fodinicurvata fenggangensis]|uniref:flagellar assembly protein FliW n=1 Tax=Fodinicurvata fenggangensis TaxID=1121830 RepID=UPI000478DE4B|nr:flagellar assembly protein FliW [Fodinicurvata fenggangensis]